MKEMIVAALEGKVGLTKAQAEKAADVVLEIVQAKGGAIAGKLGGDALGKLGGLVGGGK